MTCIVHIQIYFQTVICSYTPLILYFLLTKKLLFVTENLWRRNDTISKEKILNSSYTLRGMDLCLLHLMRQMNDLNL